MSCAREPSTFRLLDSRVGWDPEHLESIEGTGADDGIQLAFLGEAGGHLSPHDLSRWLMPARLAPGCSPCEWYLVTPSPPTSRLLRKDACEPRFSEPSPGAVGVIEDAVAVASAGREVAVSDRGRDAVLLFADRGRRQITSAPFPKPGPLAYAPWGEWLVVEDEGNRLARLDRGGFSRGHHQAPLPGPVDRIGVDAACRVWLAVRTAPVDGSAQVSLWVAGRFGEAFQPASFDELQRAFPATDLTRTHRRGFCLAGEGKDDCCFSWYGRPLADAPEPEPRHAQYATQGQLLSRAIDSGIPRCRWHRVRAEGRVPSGASLSIAVSSHDSPNPPAQGIAEGEWVSFEPGLPHPADWQEANGSRDFLIQQPPGRYLFVRVRMKGDGMQTPRISRLRVDFPRQTSLDQLPLVFRDGPEAEDFGERFLSLFDAFLEEADERIERLPALLDVAGVPDAVVPWLGSFLDVAMDAAWEPDKRRRILQAAPRLYRMRGTLDGLRAAIRLVFDVEPMIREYALERPWGALRSSSLNGGVRLFGPSSWRFRLDRSRLGRAPLRSFGRTDLDPFAALAYRFEVSVPIGLDPPTRERLEQLIEAQKPAHTLVRIHDGSGHFVLGAPPAVGIDTVFRGFEPSVLGPERGLPLGRHVLSGVREKTLEGWTNGLPSGGNPR